MHTDAIYSKHVSSISLTERFTLSQVAYLTGVHAKAIRYYESVGLLPPPSRGANNYRRYSMAEVNRLILLRRIRYLGVPLVEAKALLSGAIDVSFLAILPRLDYFLSSRLLYLQWKRSATRAKIVTMMEVIPIARRPSSRKKQKKDL